MKGCHLLAGLLLTTLCACGGGSPVLSTPDPVPPPPSSDAVSTGGALAEAEDCAADRHEALTGQLVEAVQDRLPHPHRIYRRDQPVTMDYRPERLNVIIDEKGRIRGLHCG